MKDKNFFRRKKLLAAILVFYQAVFLFAPINVILVSASDQPSATNITTEPATIEITWVDAFQSPLSGDFNVYISLNQEVDKVDFTIEGPDYKYDSGIKDSSTKYYFFWSTTQSPDGYYTVTAHAYKGDLSATKSFSIQVTNGQTENTTTSQDNLSESSIAEPLIITFVEKIDSPFSGDKRITVSLNQEVESVKFFVSGPVTKEYNGIIEPSGHYYFNWYAREFPDGFYEIKAHAIQGLIVETKMFTVDVKNSITEPISPKIDTIDIVDTATQRIDEFYPDKNYEIKEWTEDIPEPTIFKEEFTREDIKEEILPECKRAGILDYSACRQYIELSPECRQKGIATKEECNKYMFIPPECRQKGYSKEECDKYMVIPPECRQKGITDVDKCKEYMNRFVMPRECLLVGAKTQNECNKIIFLNSLPKECRQAGVTSREECDEVMRLQARLSTECLEANISDPEECNKYMAEKFMPPECREAGIKTKEECDYMLRNKYRYDNFKEEIKDEIKYFEQSIYFDKEDQLPDECREAGIVSQEECDRIMFAKKLPRECKKAGATTKEECDKIMFLERMPRECKEANITDSEECDKYMTIIYLPEECQKAGASSGEECEQILFKKHTPQECLEARIYDPEECDKYMFQKFAPIDCREAGIMTAEACKKFMFEKYGGEDNISEDKMPIECQKAGVKTIGECEKIMQEMYMPKECSDQGITNGEACELYMQQKYMPKECQEAGAKTRGECDKIMFKKYSPQECIKAGIEDEQDCEEFMFNIYAPQVTCEGIDEWQCKKAIKERHLGNIVANQVKFKEVKEKLVHLAGEVMSVEELGAILEIAKEEIPLKKKGINLKVIATQGKLILDGSDNLVQTAPIALMIDSDKDGLPDDMEIRFGTDSAKFDSDGDGYNDGVEMRNSYNPLGSGLLDKEIAPIDEAIIENKILGHPKTEGEESKDLTIENFKNIISAEEEGYEISGKAEPNSVVTVYFYSDLPMVVTAKADQHGNWQYTFKQSLVDGEHEIYVAVNDNTGRVITKSSPLNFFVKEAKAISVDDFIGSEIVRASSEERNFILYYIIAAFAIFVGLAAYFLFIRQKRKYLALK